MPTGFPDTRGWAVETGTPRVMVGGEDITWFRASSPEDQPTRVPGYQLTEPLGYGPSDQLVIPRTNVAFETYGAGDLHWIKNGAEVLYQRVMPGGEIVTDYRGVLLAPRAQTSGSSANITLDVAGQVSGRAAWIWLPEPAVRLMKDIGRWCHNALQEHLNIPLSPPLGPYTGRELPGEGAMNLDAWLNRLCQYSQNRNGAQRTLMPLEWGGDTWHFDFKDTTTRHFTLFADGSRIKLDLVDDVTEQPNVFWGTGVAPDGTRWFNRFYPGYFTPKITPQYPVTDDGTPGGTPINFGIGTTDEDTVEGDGITVLRIKLLEQGFLDAGEGTEGGTGGTYTQAIFDAVAELKDKAGLFDNGTMTPAAWEALWDVGVVGYSNALAGARPILQDSRTRKYRYSGTGAIIGVNDDYDASVMPIHQMTDFGNGVTKQQAIDWVRGRWARRNAVGHCWAGTITLDGIGAFTGEHDGEDWDELTADDVLPNQDIRPGMNAWLPYFDGGTQFHVSGVRFNRDDDGKPTAVLYVDTIARDLLELSEVLQRNRESRRDPRREWLIGHQEAKPRNVVVSADEWFGMVDRNVALKGGEWNTIQVITGFSGSVNRTHIRLFDDQAEFCFAFISGEVTPAQLQNRLGNPFPVVEDTGETVWDTDATDDWFDQRRIRLAYGTEKQPAGYGRRKKNGLNGNRTAAPLTGTYIDDTAWTYLSVGDRRPFVTLAIYPDRDCKLRRGKMLWVQVDDVV